MAVAWVEVSRVWPWTPPEDRRVTVVYRPDGPAHGRYAMPRAAAKAAVAEGAGRRIRAPRTAEAAAEVRAGGPVSYL